MWDSAEKFAQDLEALDVLRYSWINIAHISKKCVFCLLQKAPFLYHRAYADAVAAKFYFFTNAFTQNDLAHGGRCS